MASLLATSEVVSPAAAVDHGQTVLLAPTSRELPVLQPNPIPADWVLEGRPEARAIELTPAGKGCSSGLWACTAGRFRWYFASDEIIRVLNGEVRLTFDNGSQQVARAGDVVAFRGGSFVDWDIPEYLEKFWVLGPAPSVATRVVRKLRRVLHAR
jgi:uncharacterized cupin superfamily protein